MAGAREAGEAAQAAVAKHRARLEESKQAQSAQQNRGAMLTQLMKAARTGGPLSRAGLHGRLGDLGTIDTKYDTAVTMASSWLEALVVDTAQGAQQCIEFLRSHKLGRARVRRLRRLLCYTTRSLFSSLPSSLPVHRSGQD